MKPLFFLLLLVTIYSCKKETLKPPPAQQMEYKDLEGKEIGYNEFTRLDLDNNGTIDVAFTTYHIGDPLMQMDKIQFCAKSLIDSYFPVTTDDNVSMLNAGDWITTKSKTDYEWFQITLLVLAQKNIPLSGSLSWTGTWKSAHHNFLPVQLEKQGKRYNGWIELSYNMESEKIILHRSAISKIANMDIKAGL